MDYDYVVIGSGFGGSVSALRLAEKGYRVLVLEKGERFGPGDFPRSNWNLRRWLWLPALGCRGIMQTTFLRHLTALSGVGVGGGSLVYAGVLAEPREGFYRHPGWRDLADWRQELEPHFRTALRMLGAEVNPRLYKTDQFLEELTAEMGRVDQFRPTTNAVYFGRPGVTVEDPYFQGKGPNRTGCIHCGRCMLGCPHNAKNTLDKNYLYLAERRRVEIRSGTKVHDVQPRGLGGYIVSYRSRSANGRTEERSVTASGVVFAGGVLGTVPLLLRLKVGSLPKLSDRLGHGIRTNGECLIGLVSLDPRRDHSQGVSVTSLAYLDEETTVELVRYPQGSGILRWLSAPHVAAAAIPLRWASAVAQVARHPLRHLRAWLVRDVARSSQILLFMQTAEATLRLELKASGRITSRIADGPPPVASHPLATSFAERLAARMNAVLLSLTSETALGIPTTAHVLGGCCMGQSVGEGVIDRDNRLFGYQNLYVIDGSMISANPGINPALTITALAERAMSKIPVKEPPHDDPRPAGCTG